MKPISVRRLSWQLSLLMTLGIISIFNNNQDIRGRSYLSAAVSESPL